MRRLRRSKSGRGRQAFAFVDQRFARFRRFTKDAVWVFVPKWPDIQAAFIKDAPNTNHILEL